jgi:outer membrane protein TolC
LTLEQALAFAEAAHPDLDRAQARLRAAQAGLDQAESTNGVRAFIDLTPQWVLPSLRIDDEMVKDSRARFQLSKRLYDFGRTASLGEAARADIAARELTLLDTRQARRLDILARYLDVLLADLRYAVDNEAMAHQYVNFDRRANAIASARFRMDLLELEQRYQETFILRTRSQKRQAQSRLALAIALNRPDELPAEHVLPPLPGNNREVPEHKALLEQALRKNPALVALRQDTEAARAQVAAERARRYPVLSAEGEAAYYERDFVSRDDLRATLNLRVPLWQGSEDRAAIALALARLHEQEARRGAPSSPAPGGARPGTGSGKSQDRTQCRQGAHQLPRSLSRPQPRTLRAGSEKRSRRCHDSHHRGAVAGRAGGIPSGPGVGATRCPDR